MRKFLALALVAGLALSSAFALTGCSKQESSSESTTTTEQPMSSMPDTGMTDTTAAPHDSM